MSHADASRTLGIYGLLILGGVVLAIGVGIWSSKNDNEKAVDGIRYEAVRAGFVKPYDFNDEKGQLASVEHFIERYGYWRSAVTLSKEEWQKAEMDAFKMLATSLNQKAVIKATQGACSPSMPLSSCNYFRIAQWYKGLLEDDVITANKIKKTLQ